MILLPERVNAAVDGTVVHIIAGCWLQVEESFPSDRCAFLSLA